MTTVLNQDDKTFVVYIIAILRVIIKMTIYQYPWLKSIDRFIEYQKDYRSYQIRQCLFKKYHRKTT